jgi:hypothetical protein
MSQGIELNMFYTLAAGLLHPAQDNLSVAFKPTRRQL